MNKILDEFIQLNKKIKESTQNSIPLCAAETYISDFVKQALISDFEGKYSAKDSSGKELFVNGLYIEQLNSLITTQCKTLFSSCYTNAETLTGINCFTVCAMSLLSPDNRLLITTPEQGGHPSIPIILETLGIEFDSIPYDYENYQIDYPRTQKYIDSNKYSYILFCQSDIIALPDLSRINIPNHIGIIYDATQTIGLIAGKACTNPLASHHNVVLIGGTHKTLPAPACGLIMTNNSNYEKQLKDKITPNYLRNTQPNHIACLLLALIEQEELGYEYQKKVIETSNSLAYELEKYGFNIAKIAANEYSTTHQIFLLMNKSDAETLFANAHMYNITLNLKNKKLFSGYGIRLGTQQISRYNWGIDELKSIAELLFLLTKKECDKERILQLRKSLIDKKIPQFNYENIIIE